MKQSDLCTLGMGVGSKLFALMGALAGICTGLLVVYREHAGHIPLGAGTAAVVWGVVGGLFVGGLVGIVYGAARVFKPLSIPSGVVEGLLIGVLAGSRMVAVTDAPDWFMFGYGLPAGLVGAIAAGVWHWSMQRRMQESR